MVVYEKWSHMDARLYTPKLGDKHPPPLANEVFPGIWHFLLLSITVFTGCKTDEARSGFSCHTARDGWEFALISSVRCLWRAQLSLVYLPQLMQVQCLHVILIKTTTTTTHCYFLFKKKEKKKLLPSTLDKKIDSRAGEWSEGFPFFIWVEYFIIGKKRT